MTLISALFRLFKLFEILKPDRALEQRRHPYPMLRWFSLKQMAIQVGIEYGVPTVQDVASRGWISGQAVWSVMTDTRYPNLDEMIVSDIKPIPDAIRVAENWRNLRVRLAPLNRGTSELTPALKPAVIDQMQKAYDAIT
jgi:hypothetical protein